MLAGVEAGAGASRAGFSGPVLQVSSAGERQTSCLMRARTVGRMRVRLMSRHHSGCVAVALSVPDTLKERRETLMRGTGDTGLRVNLPPAPWPLRWRCLYEFPSLHRCHSERRTRP